MRPSNLNHNLPFASLLLLVAGACGAGELQASPEDAADARLSSNAEVQPQDAADPLGMAVTVVATIPPETPAAQSVRLTLAGAVSRAIDLDCGAASTRCVAELTLPAGFEGTLSLSLADGQQAVNLDGSPRAPEPLTLPATGGGDPRTAGLQVDRWGAPGTGPAAAVAFIVRPPASTPPHEALHVTGSLPELGAWDGRGRPLEAARDGALAAVVSLVGADTSFEYKITRGVWYTVEKGAGGEEIANRAGRVEPGRLVRLEASPAGWADLVPPGSGTLVGEVRRWQGVRSEHLERPRDVLVWLPPGYRDDSRRRYPVLYAHDGQNLMDAETAFGGREWRLDEALDAAIRAGEVPPFIAVAVGNTADRIGEYTPTATPEYGGGSLPAYGRFLVDELKPMIDHHFRTRTRALDTAVMGSSLGGLASLWLGLAHPEVFGRLGVVSPSVWWDGRVILQAVNDFEGPALARVWVDIGSEEGRGGETVADARALRDALVAKGFDAGGRLAYREYPGAGHDEGAWAARLPELLRFLLAEP
jgi:enterochelin esterase-like enzyme